ncbi:MAG: cell division protein ZapA [Rhodobacteraceae bacterium]|nr:cell division protein ZapA [Paracoccaceae bacterium]
MHRFSINLGTRILSLACSEEEAAVAAAAARLLEEKIRLFGDQDVDRSLVETLALAGLNLASESPRLKDADGKSAADREADEEVVQLLQALAEELESAAADLATVVQAGDRQSEGMPKRDQEL